MGFASTYIEERILFPQYIKEAPDKNTAIIIVIPAYNERDLTLLLDSLQKCRQPQCKVEVIVVINAPENAPEDCIENNRQTVLDIISWKEKNPGCFFRLFYFSVEKPLVKGWGVGLARKTGMDEALRRLDSINNPNGIILNLDADCTVEENYLEAVFSELYNEPSHSACSIYFEHPASGQKYSENIYRYIVLYELHLRYYIQALSYTGFPWVFHTVGSSIAVKALPYIKVGGMNRKQAGEDFYFVQKLVPLGGYFSLNSTTVHPSPRISVRVPFGTGASINKLMADESPTFRTYSFNAFSDLRAFFGYIERVFDSQENLLFEIYSAFPDGLKSYMSVNEWTEKMIEIKTNTSNFQSFSKRFFNWFNMFKIVKYLNHVHNSFYEKVPVEKAALELIESSAHNSLQSTDPLNLLTYYRNLEKSPNSSSL
jgi:hypothetical protein